MNSNSTATAENANSRENSITRIFVSYAHAHRDYFNVFIQDFRNYTKNLPSEIDIYTDEQIPVGKDWHQDIQKAVAECDIAILLVSDAFMNSPYIIGHEVENLLNRMNSKDGVHLIPVYFYPCPFQDWPFLSKYQFFKPLGQKYERADKDENNSFCYAHLCKFNDVNGVNRVIPNPNRGEYMMDLVAEIRPLLKAS